MKRPALLWVFIVLGFVLVLLVGIAAVLGPGPSSDPDPTRSVSPSGYSLLRRFLLKLGYAPRRGPDPADPWPEGGAAVFLGYPDWDEDALDDFYDWVDSGGMAICLGGEDDQWLEGFSYLPGQGRLKASDPWSPAAGLDLGYDGLVFGPLPDYTESVAGTDSGAAFASVEYGNGTFILGSDLSLLDNATMRAGGEEYAVLVNELFKPAFGGPVRIYSGQGGGDRARSSLDPVRALFRGRFLPFTLQALAACAALALALLPRFGSPLRWNGRARRASLEHVEAVGRFMLRAGASAQAELSNASFFRHRLRTLLRIGPDQGDGRLAEAAAAALMERSARPPSDPEAARRRGMEALASLLEGDDRAGDARMRRRARDRREILKTLERSPS